MNACSVYFKGLVTVFVLALIFIIVAVPLALRKVPRNVVYGFRTPRTLKSDPVWYEANAYFGRALIYATIVSMLMVFPLYYFVQMEPDLFFKTSLLAMVVPSGIAVVATLIHIRGLDDRP